VNGCSSNRSVRTHALAALTRWLGRLLLGLWVGSLVACAGHTQWREGQQLIDRGQVEQGLSKLEEAVALNPGSGEFRRDLALARERALRTWTERAEASLAAGDADAARGLLQRVLQVSPGSDRARVLLASIDRQAEIRRSLDQVRQAMAAQNWSLAQRLLLALADQDPGHAEVQALLREVARQTRPDPSDGALSQAFRTPISIEFRDVPLKQAFEVLSKTSGLNFVFDKDVKTDARTSIFLKNSTVEAALYFLLLTNQLEQQVMNSNTLLVYPNTPAKAKEYQELSVRSFQMVSADARTVAATIKSLFKGRDVVVDEKLNMLVVRDTPETLRLIEKVVALHDVPDAEVMLEVEILEVGRSRLMDLGVRWPDTATFAPLAADGGTALTLADLRRLGREQVGVTVGNLTVKARKEDTDINILANPRIRVINREKAKVLIGDKLPLITSSVTSTGVTSESISYQDVGLRLEVEPTIYRGNDMVIKVGLEVSSIAGTQVSKQGTTAYTIGTRTANTVLRLRDGENQILAGLINDEDRRAANKVPGLGELPVAGRLFGSSLDESKRTEIVLSITPRLVRNAHRTDNGLQEFRSGTENSTRLRPLGPATAVELAPSIGAAVPREAGPGASVRLPLRAEGLGFAGKSTLSQPVDESWGSDGAAPVSIPVMPTVP